eukprot:SAG11_NODE_3364_length_2497_cov_2.449124_4_plen_298_part_00
MEGLGAYGSDSDSDDDAPAAVQTKIAAPPPAPAGKSFLAALPKAHGRGPRGASKAGDEEGGDEDEDEEVEIVPSGYKSKVWTAKLPVPPKRTAGSRAGIDTFKLAGKTLLKEAFNDGAEVEEEESRHKKPKLERSGLFGMLPQPKHSVPARGTEKTLTSKAVKEGATMRRDHTAKLSGETKLIRPSVSSMQREEVAPAATKSESGESLGKGPGTSTSFSASLEDDFGTRTDHPGMRYKAPALPSFSAAPNVEISKAPLAPPRPVAAAPPAAQPFMYPEQRAVQNAVRDSPLKPIRYD